MIEKVFSFFSLFVLRRFMHKRDVKEDDEERENPIGLYFVFKMLSKLIFIT